MSLRITDFEGVTIVRFLDSKYLDDAKIQKVEIELMEAAQNGARIVLDFSGVRFISSTMIAKLVYFNKAVKCAQGKWAMYSVFPTLMEAFLITKLNEAFRIVEDEKAALKHVNESPS